MAKQFVSWVHGYAAVAEWMGPALVKPPVDRTRGEADFFPDFSDVNGWRRAWGAFFKLAPGRDNWFHIPIPTPVLVEDRRAGLDRVMALFRIDDGGQLRHVLVFDGPNLIHDQGVSVFGDHTGDLVVDSNVFHVDHDNINFGVGLSLNFSTLEHEQVPADLYIASAGGIFFHNI